MTNAEGIDYDLGDPTAPHRRVTLDELRAHRDAIYAIAAKYGVSNIRVFGSVARDEADDDSDLDLLIDIERGHGYFDMAGFAIDVEEMFRVFTQVVTPNGIKQRMRDEILGEAVPI